jgi:transglutaminase-like putative cysteine protease
MPARAISSIKPARNRVRSLQARPCRCALSCQDLAALFIEAVRSLGFGARLVSGDLHDPTRTLLGSADAGSTHAWAEVYLPGAGWITFDPTNRAMGGANLIPVAVVRDIRQAMPVSGSFIGPADALLEMSVAVRVVERGARRGSSPWRFRRSIRAEAERRPYMFRQSVKPECFASKRQSCRRQSEQCNDHVTS